jgi:hypothetical protein
MIRSHRASLFALIALPLALVACSDEGEVSPGELSGSGGSSATTTTSTSASTSTSTSTTTTTGTGGAGGASTSTSAGGHGGATTTTGAGGQGGAGQGGAGQGGAGGGTACTWQAGKNPCGAGFYCDGCAGTCVAEPAAGAEEQAKAPVCGCDGATYWNASIAASHKVGVKSAGACASGGTCGGFGGQGCAAGLYCNYSVEPNVCQIADGAGQCWAMPATCKPEAGIGPQARACGAQSCAYECDLVKQQVAFQVDGGCPK